MADTDRLIREANPPSGRIASPVPQYKHYTTGIYEDAEGSDGAIHVAALTEKIVDLKSLLDNFGEVQATPTSNTLLDRVKVIKTELDALQAQIGEISDAAVAAGATGSISAKIRRLTTDLGALLTAFNAVDFATQTTLLAETVQIGDTDAAVVDAGAVGSLSAKMRRLTTDLDAFKTAFEAVDFSTQTTLLGLKNNFDAKVAMETFGNGAPGAHAGEAVGAMYLDITNGDIYASTGAAWVLKEEGIWD